VGGAVEVQLVDGPARQRLTRLLEAAGDGPAGRAIRKRLGQAMLADQRRMAIERSEPEGEFQRLGFVTTLLRRQRGPAHPLVTPADVAAKQATLRPLQDHRILYRSLQAGAPGNVLVAERESVTVGTADRRAPLHQHGGHQTFVFTEELQERFDRNVSKTARNAEGKLHKKPRKLKSGKRRKWKAAGKESPWNRWYFIWRNWLAKVSGQSFPVPRRRLVVEPTPGQRSKYARILLDALKRALGK